MTPFRCAVASLQRSEPLLATASRVDRWLLVEHCSAWSGETLPRYRLDGALVGALEQLAAREKARLLLIRRPGGATTPGRRLFFADSRPGSERLLASSVDHDRELLSIGLPGEEPAGWSVAADRLLLVCTHGRRDPCCAIWGRPVAEALARHYPLTTWECTHIGGDRFAPNLLVLPEGYYFGRVPPAEAAGIVAELDAGRLASQYLRGRSSLSLPVQAAQFFARAAVGSTGATELALLDIVALTPESWRVRLAAASGEVAVTVHRVPAPEQQLTCHARQPQPIPVFQLVDLSAE